jgi:hypothetical protein
LAPQLPSPNRVDRQIGHDADAGVVIEAEGEVGVSLGIENRQRPLEVRSSADEVSGVPVGKRR